MMTTPPRSTLLTLALLAGCAAAPPPRPAPPSASTSDEDSRTGEARPSRAGPRPGDELPSRVLPRTDDVVVRVGGPQERYEWTLPLPTGGTLVGYMGRRFVVEGESVREADVAVLPGILGAEVHDDGIRFFGVDGSVYTAAGPLEALRLMAPRPARRTSPVQMYAPFAVRAAPLRSDPADVFRFDGRGWSKLPLPLPAIDVAFLDSEHALAILLGGRAVVTEDGGAHFVDVPLPTPVNRVEVSGDGYAVVREWVGFDGGGSWGRREVSKDGHVLGEPPLFGRPRRDEVGRRAAFRALEGHIASSISFSSGSEPFVTPCYDACGRWNGPEDLWSYGVRHATNDFVVVSESDDRHSRPRLFTVGGDEVALPIRMEDRHSVWVREDGQVLVVEKDLHALYSGPARGPYVRHALPEGLVAFGVLAPNGAAVALDAHSDVHVSRDLGATFERLSLGLPPEARPQEFPKFRCTAEHCSTFLQEGYVIELHRAAPGDPSPRVSMLEVRADPARTFEELRCSGENPPSPSSYPTRERRPFALGDAQGAFLVEVLPPRNAEDYEPHARLRVELHGRDGQGEFTLRTTPTHVDGGVGDAEALFVARDHAVLVMNGFFFVARPNQPLEAHPVVHGPVRWMMATGAEGERLVAGEDSGFVRAFWLDAHGRVLAERDAQAWLVAIGTTDGELRLVYGIDDDDTHEVRTFTESRTSGIAEWRRLPKDPRRICTSESRDALRLPSQAWNPNLGGWGSIVDVRAGSDGACQVSVDLWRGSTVSQRPDGTFAGRGASGEPIACTSSTSR